LESEAEQQSLAPLGKQVPTSGAGGELGLAVEKVVFDGGGKWIRPFDTGQIPGTGASINSPVSRIRWGECLAIAKRIQQESDLTSGA
jgi:hypothetical protein